MQWSRKTVLTATGLTILVIVGAVFLYSGYRRNEASVASPASELLSQLPSGAFAVIFVDVDSIRRSRFYQDRSDHAPFTVPDRDYSNFIQATGFDFEKDLDRAAIAFWPQTSTLKTTRTVVLAEGRFDRRKIRDYAMRVGKIARQQGRDVFLFPADNAQTAPQRGPQTEPRRWNALVFLDDHRVAIIEGTDIAPLLAPRSDDSADSLLREHVARVAGTSVFAVSRVLAVPDNYALGGMKSAQLASMIRSVQWITLAAQPEGDTVRVSLEGQCDTDTDARQLQSALEVLRLFGQAGLESPKTRQQMDPTAYSIVQALLKTADISESGALVRVHMELPPDVLKSNGSNKTK